MLNINIFSELQVIFKEVDIDLFASKHNKQCVTYVSWKPDDKAFAVDAFSFKWTHFYGYIFPPFSLVGKILQKIENDQALALLVVPLCPCGQHRLGSPNYSDFENATVSRSSASSSPAIETDCFQNVGESLRQQGIQAGTIRIITDSWRNSTRMQYRTNIKK